MLFRAAAHWSEAELIARAGDQPSPAVKRAFDRLVRERATRRPLQHLVGEVDFFGLTLAVGPGALIPRPDTETLVEAALTRFSGDDTLPFLLADVGCGSGAIALTLASRLPASRFVAIDNARGALELAAENSRRCHLESRVQLVGADLLTAVRPGTLDGVVANLPYVPDSCISRLEPEVRDHEPRDALAGGPDGLDPLRRLVRMASLVLRPTGWLLVEIGAGQDEAAAKIISSAGLRNVEMRADLAGIPRVLIASAAPAG